MMKKLILLLFVFIIIVEGVDGQSDDPTNYIRTDLISASPNAESISKYGDVPVSMYNGQANVSIPLYHYQGAYLDLPLTLSYNYSGFKPSQEASWVGLGWDINAGGVITRSIRDKIDDTFPVGQNYSDVYDSILSLATDQDFLRNLMDPVSSAGLVDAEPDIYSYSFPGGSGKFIIVDGEFYPLPYKPYKFSGSPTTGFTITTDNGTVYTYDVIETTHPIGQAGAKYTMPVYNSSFYLSSIVHPTGDYINYIYSGGTRSILQPGVTTQTFRKWIPSGSPNYLGEKIFNPRTSYPTEIQDVKELAQIITPSVKFIFTPGSGRTDINGTSSHTLGEISIENGDNEEILTIDFSHGYFGGSSHLSSYLKLKNVRLTGRIDDANVVKYPDKVYSFTYNNEASSLPNSLNLYVDHYGYLKYSSVMSVFVPDEFNGQELAGAYGINRDPNFDYAKYFSLQKIEYPTGGFTEFQYESNIIENDSIVYESTGELLTVCDTIERESMTGILETVFKEFTVTHSQDFTLTINRTLKAGKDPTENQVKEVEIYDYDPASHEIGTPLTLGIRQYFNGGTKVVETHHLQKGVYLLKLKLDDDETYVDATIAYAKNTPHPGLTGPGIRIKEIKSFPSISEEPIVKSYTYLDPFGFTSGKTPTHDDYYRGLINYRTNLHEARYEAFNGGQVFIQNAWYLMISSSMAQSHNPGHEIFYNRVEERTKSENGDIKTIYHFENFQSNEPLNFLSAMIKNKTIYAFNGNEYRVVQREVHEYVEKPYSLFSGIMPYVSIDLYSPSGVTSPTYRTFESFNYHIHQRELQPYSKTIYSYGNDGRESKYREVYNYKKSNLIESRSEYPDGKVITKRLKYPADYIPLIAANLVIRNILNSPIEVQTWKEIGGIDRMISGVITEYLKFGIPDKRFFLETSQAISDLDSDDLDSNDLYTSFISDSRYLHRLSYNYTTSNRLQSQVLPTGTSEGYIWGYDDTHPIATVTFPKGQNLDSINAYHTSFEDLEGTLNSDSRTGRKVRVSNYTVTLEGLPSDTYLLTWWRKESGEWVLKNQSFNVNSSNGEFPDGVIDHTITATSSNPIDEVRLIPENAEMSTYTYIPNVGIKSVTDPNQITTNYVVDTFGKLKRIIDQHGNTIQEVETNIKE